MTDDDTPMADRSRTVSYDPGFRSAVEDGFLTPVQALQRGRRETCASRLAVKHGLTQRIALDVADNRLSLGQAIRKQRSPVNDAATRRERTRSIGIGWLALAAPAALFLAAFAWYVSTTASPAELEAALRPSVLTDDEGRVTRVAAGDPESVLAAYCDAMKLDTPCEPTGLIQATSADAGLRVGVFVDPAAVERLLAIPIRRDRGTGRWVAGDGESPLDALLAPHNAASFLERGDDKKNPRPGGP